MGFGLFHNGGWDLTVSFGGRLSPAERPAWEKCLTDASALLYRATHGQMFFRRLFLADDSVADAGAEDLVQEDDHYIVTTPVEAYGSVCERCPLLDCTMRR